MRGHRPRRHAVKRRSRARRRFRGYLERVEQGRDGIGTVQRIVEDRMAAAYKTLREAITRELYDRVQWEF